VTRLDNCISDSRPTNRLHPKHDIDLSHAFGLKVGYSSQYNLLMRLKYKEQYAIQGRHFSFFQGGKILADFLGGGAKYEKYKIL